MRTTLEPDAEQLHRALLAGWTAGAQGVELTDMALAPWFDPVTGAAYQRGFYLGRADRVAFIARARREVESAAAGVAP